MRSELHGADIPRRMPAHETALIVLSLLSVAARLLQLQGLHPIVWDEIEYFRATDWVRHGLVPYRDFWEHHTPLQWFLFAPASALTNSPGVSAIVLMRWSQLPLWILAFVLLRGWMRRAGVSRFGAWVAIALTLCSSLFMLPAVEYRVDVLGCVVYIAALALLQRMDEGRGYAFFAGVMLCLTGFANLRLGPLAVLTLLLARVVSPGQRAWRGNARANWSFAGAAAAFAVCASYFVATHSALIAWQRLWSDNFAADRLAQSPVDFMFLRRFAIAFGVSLVDSAPTFHLSVVDPAGIVIIIVGAIAIVRVLGRDFQAPGDAFFLAFLQAANLLFIAAMKYVFNYHLEIVILMMAPLVAIQIDRFVHAEARRNVVIAFVVLAMAVNVAAAVFRGKEADTVYQDFIMREVDRLTPANACVWDSVGWALRRRPAYRYWFLRPNVFLMEAHQRFESYRIEDVVHDPPQAIVADRDVRIWIGEHPHFGEFIVRDYLPLWRDLWLPALNARLTPAAPAAQWIVLADGAYDIYASSRLASHPWYRQPLDLEAPIWSGATITSADRGAHIDWFIDDRLVPPSESIMLRRGQRVMAISREPLPVGVMLIGAQNAFAFCKPPKGVTIDGSAPPAWHVPNLRALADMAHGTPLVQVRVPCSLR